jgi:hypothetical protein
MLCSILQRSHQIYGKVQEGPWYAGDAVEPKAIERCDVKGHYGAEVVAISLSGVECAYDKLTGNFNLEEQLITVWL